ncbi:MAG TPA: RNA polymerase factor sigma-54 [Gammaproteobacteria bacterium]|nr:RNA polymerase factor sigma-54 [Gammaproteobacteria bacterium]
MKQTLQLKLGQQLTMTPQLQQAIRLLQLSTLELQAEIQEALESNPMLEVVEDGAAEGAPPAAGESGAESGVDEDGTAVAEDASERAADSPSEDMPNDLPVDSDWEDTYENYTPVTRGAQDNNDFSDFEQPASQGESLQDHLQWQLNLTPFSDTDRIIATALIDAIDDDGYFTSSCEEIHQSLQDELDIELDEVEAVLNRVQDFDPPGVAARSLQESMLLQLRYYDADTPWLAEARQIVDEHFNLLAKRDFHTLKRRMKLPESGLQQVIQLIQTLNPRPGGQIASTPPEYIIPDVFVKKVKGQWRVELNPDIAPKIAINSLYAGMAKQNGSKDAAFLKNSLQEARWFLKSLRSRNETLLKVSNCIVERQRGFFEYGEEAMKPMVMHDIAEVVEMHESTISRVTTKKYMHTPRGIFELKYFFSSHVGTANGGECSATAIRAILKKLIAAENPGKPLSDNKLAQLLGEQGINVARRTVAKYREAMSIAPSNERKRLT